MKVFNLLMICLFSASIANGPLNETELTDTQWVNEIVPNYCSDSLKFTTDSTAIYYSCEMTWHYDATYEIEEDLIKIWIVDAQFEVDDITGMEPTSKWILKLEDSQLKYLYIGHKRKGEFEEVSDEIYKNIKNFQKLE